MVRAPFAAIFSKIRGGRFPVDEGPGLMPSVWASACHLRTIFGRPRRHLHWPYWFMYNKWTSRRPKVVMTFGHDGCCVDVVWPARQDWLSDRKVLSANFAQS